MTGEHEQVYLLTDDVHHLIAGWAERHRLMPPHRGFFAALAGELQDALARMLGCSVRVIPTDVLADGIRTRIDEHASDFPIVCVDRVFASVIPEGRRHMYDMARAMAYRDGAWRKAGEGPRPGCPPLDEQVASIVERIGGTRTIVIVDDGCYDGDSLRAVARRFTDAGFSVACAIVGIQRVRSAGHALAFPIHAVLRYPEDEIVDWVGMRDFIFGCPEGGRVVAAGTNGNASIRSAREYGVPYLHGFGDLEAWASIPSGHAAAFTEVALQITQQLYLGIERTSRTPVHMGHLARWPCDCNGHPIPVDSSVRVADVIERLRRESVAAATESVRA